MFLNNNNQCVCLDGYVLRQSGTSCRFNCNDGFKYNPSTDLCEIIKVIACDSGFTYNPATQQC